MSEQRQEQAVMSGASGATAQTVAAIDIGSNSVRMVIAEVDEEGRIEFLERLYRGVRLGQDAFRRGRISVPTMRAAVTILRDFRRLLDFYDVKQLRAVATSAVREANNSDTFLDRIMMATGLDVEVIDTTEESRLTVSAVREALGEEIDWDHTTTLIVEVGGGSTLLTLLKKDEIITSQSLRLGSIRLQEDFATAQETPRQGAEILRHQIHNLVASARNTLPLRKIKTLIAVGSDARFASRQAGKAVDDSEELFSIERERFDAFVASCIDHAPEDFVKMYGLAFADAETLSPALLVLEAILQETRAPQMHVCQVSMRDGLLLDLARTVTGTEDTMLVKGVEHSAMALAQKFHVDLNHAHQVAEVATRLYDSLQEEHGLGRRYRLLLRVAGLLHEVGGFISQRAHHKHSYYLISHSEVFGLNHEELEVVAQVARYHRRSTPKPTHPSYMTLPREKRMVVSKLAAILRVADALDGSHAQQVSDFSCRRQDDEFVIQVFGVADLTMERRGIMIKGDLFEDIYGMRVRLEEAPATTPQQRRAKAVE